MHAAPAAIIMAAPLIRAASITLITLADGAQPQRRTLTPKPLRAEHTTRTITTSSIAAMSRSGSGTGLPIRGDWSASAEPHQVARAHHRSVFGGHCFGCSRRRRIPELYGHASQDGIPLQTIRRVEFLEYMRIEVDRRVA